MSGIDDGSLRRNDLDWIHQSRTRGHFALNQAAKYIRNSRDCDGFDGIQRAGNLRGAAGKIDPSAIILDGHAHANRYFTRADPVIVKRVLTLVAAVWNRGNGATHHA